MITMIANKRTEKFIIRKCSMVREISTKKVYIQITDIWNYEVASILIITNFEIELL